MGEITADNIVDVIKEKRTINSEISQKAQELLKKGQEKTMIRRSMELQLDSAYNANTQLLSVRKERELNKRVSTPLLKELGVLDDRVQGTAGEPLDIDTYREELRKVNEKYDKIKKEINEEYQTLQNALSSQYNTNRWSVSEMIDKY